MTREEIKSSIALNIKSQGNQLDAGGKLGGILENIMSLFCETSEVDDSEEFDPTTYYSKGDVVRKDGKLYVFTTEHEGEWDEEDVEQTNVMNIILTAIANGVNDSEIGVLLDEDRKKEIEDASLLQFGESIYVKSSMTSELYDAVETQFGTQITSATFAKAACIWLNNYQYQKVGGTLTLGMLDALAFVEDSNGGYWIIRVQV